VTDQRQRQRQRRQARLAAERAARRRRRRRVATGGAAVAVVLGLGTVAVVARPEDGDDEAARQERAPSPTEAQPESDQGADCPPTEKPVETPRSVEGPFPHCLEDGVDYRAVVTTSRGEFTIDLAEAAAPITVNNFVALSRWGWFDGDDFHRVVPGFVIQAGDPVGTPPGTGGPGYAIPDELPDEVGAYVEGAVAMANAGPETGGSQFFVCLDCSSLPGPDYSLFGQVTAGIEVVKTINYLGQGDGPPREPVAIESVEITER
jgi:cyclophilin family peptidyl-prolyl cis-trans isomerase